MTAGVDSQSCSPDDHYTSENGLNDDHDSKSSASIPIFEQTLHTAENEKVSQGESPKKDTTSITEKDDSKQTNDNKQIPNASYQPTTNKDAPYQSNRLNLEEQLIKAKRDLESMVIRYAKSEAENLQNKSRSEELDRKLKRAIKDNESLANRIKILTNDKKQLADTLSARVAQMTVLEQKSCALNSTQNIKLKELEKEIEQLHRTNEELEKTIETYKCKEGELLDFNERLTLKQTELETELDVALKREPNQQGQYEELVNENATLQLKLEELTEQLRLSNNRLATEKKLTEQLRNGHAELELKCSRRVEELENEIKVARRKHQIATRELLKQMKCLQTTFDQRNTQ